MDTQIAPPQYLIIEITTTCNFRCKQCHQWMTNESAEAISTKEKLRAVKEISNLNPQAKVILTGGETMLKYDEFFAICEEGKRNNIPVISNTNGSFINDDNLFDVVKYGPEFLLLSLDSHIEKIHSFIRGKSESYRHLINIIPKLVKLRNKHNLKTNIYTHSIIFNENIHLWGDYIEFARNTLKVDAVYFQLLKETLRNQQVNKDPFFEKYFFKDLKKTEQQIDKIIATYKDDKFMGTNTFDLELMKKEIYRPKDLEHGTCNSANKNIFIDANGSVQLCLHMHEIMPHNTIGNYRNLHLEDVWYSKNAQKARDIMFDCTKNCGMINCHRKTSYDPY
jgi:radical SAM protein with 4Fe4S-binding SPASM domain